MTEPPRKTPTSPFPQAPPPPPPPDLLAGMRQSVALIAVGLAAAGVAWLAAATGGEAPVAGGRPAGGYAYSQAGVPIDAELAFYRKRVAEDPGRFLDQNALAGACLRKARESGDEGWYAQAEQAAAASLKEMPRDNPEPMLVRAQVAIAFHRFPEARRIAEAVARQHPDAGVRGVLATVALAQGRPAEAERLLTEALGRGPTTALWAQLGLARAARGNDAGAEDAFRKAIAAEQPGERLASADARAWLGRHLLRRGRLEEAEGLITEALRIYPRHGQAFGLLGELVARRGRYDEAEGRWTRAGELRHDPAPALARARIALAAGRPEKAERLWRETEALLRKDLAAGHTDHRRDLARLLLDRARPADAAEAARLLAAERAMREDAETLDLHAGALLALGRHAEADAALVKLVATGAREAPYLLRRAALARAMGAADRARALAAEAEQLDPSFRHDPAFPPLDPARPDSPVGRAGK